MPLVVVGSVALDSVETPCHVREDVLGGSAVYFSYAASFFTTVRLAGVVGEDWPPQHTELLQARGIDTAGLQIIAGAKTFRWRGRYHENMNDRDTLDLQLNVMGSFDPVLPDHYRRCQFLFLANGSTEIQLKALDQCPGANLAVADTMDHWIRSEREQLAVLLKRVDGLVLNDSRGQAPQRRAEPRRAPARRCSNWGRASWSSRKASTARCSSASTRPTSCPPTPRPRSSIRPARAIRLPAA